MKTCFCTIAFQKNKYAASCVLERPLTETLPLLASLGYDAVELWARGLDGATADQLAAVRSLLEQCKLWPAMLSHYYDFTTSAESAADSVSRGIAVIEQAGAIGAAAVRIFTGKTGSADATTEQWQRTARLLRHLAEFAGEKGIQLALETHPRNLMDTIAATQKLIDMIARDNVRIIYQPSTFHPAHMDALHALAPYICHVHATNKRNGASCRLADGEMDYRQIIAGLKDIGFDGCVCVEWLGDSPDEAARAEAPYLRSLLAAAAADALGPA